MITIIVAPSVGLHTELDLPHGRLEIPREEKVTTALLC